MWKVWAIVMAVLFGARLFQVYSLWSVPKRQGEGWFLTTEVGPDFYRGVGAMLMRRYRAWLFTPIAVDAVAIATMAAFDKLGYIVYEQVSALVLTAIFYNVLITHFALKVKALVPDAGERRATVVCGSLEARRLRDRTNWRVEAAIGVLTVVALAAYYSEPFTDLLTIVWVLYLQGGLLLLKQVFVRWRFPLPPRREDDFRRWREAWLGYHLRVFDALRLLLAAALAGFAAYAALRDLAGDRVRWAVAAAWLLACVGIAIFCIREGQRLGVVEREIRPVELVREFPPSRIAEGRFLAGGLLYFNRDNPVAVVRGPAGIGINLANRVTYVWAAYLSGLLLLVVREII
jgi:hypothetical protein